MSEYELRQDERVEDLALRFQSRQVARLNALLLLHGVSDAEVRREILSSFFFRLGAELDGDPCVELDGVQYKTVLAFAPEAEIAPLPLLYSHKFDYHDYSHSIVGEIVEDPNAKDPDAE